MTFFKSICSFYFSNSKCQACIIYVNHINKKATILGLIETTQQKYQFSSQLVSKKKHYFIKSTSIYKHTNDKSQAIFFSGQNVEYRIQTI